MVKAKSANVVIRSDDFHPARMDALWLTTNEVFSANELEDAENKVFAPVFAAFQTELVQFVATENRVQVTASEPEPPALDRMMDVVVQFLRALAEDVAITGSGLNVVWEYMPDDEDRPLHDLTAGLFLPGDSPLIPNFSDRSSVFGSYAEKDLGTFRVHLTVKPQQKSEGERGIDVLECNFNFHHDPTGDDTRADAAKALSSHSDAWEFAERVVETIAERGRDL
ncbi:MAG: hypothetical protein R6V07_03070 [Armatimonadota bacterium]